MKEGYKRGVRPAVELPDFEPHAQSYGIEVRRFNLSEQGMDVDVVSLSVDPNNNDWQETPAGLLRVDPVIIRPVRDGHVRVLRLYFPYRSEFRQQANGSHRNKNERFRELVLDEAGQAWQQLRSNVSVGRYRKKSDRPKWLHVAVVGSGEPA